MKLYFAPMEGLTQYTYRQVHYKMFGGCDEYYAPFICPMREEKISPRHLKDILPENNEGIPIKVQILSNDAEAFMNFEKKIKVYGYDEININAGCPFPMVVKKFRGAGLLRELDRLDNFLKEVFDRSELKISVKTRIGYESPDEAEDILRIYNDYPISELMVHPRTREAFYEGVPNDEVFSYIYENSKNRLCYNGNIFTVEDYNKITEKYHYLSSVMIGRGAIANPAIFREIKGGKRLETRELVEFTEVFAEEYHKLVRSETFTLHKLKGLWIYMLWNFPEEKKIAKKMKKANKIADFIAAAKLLPELN